MVGLFNASNDVSREEWRWYVEFLALPKMLPGIQGMGFTLPVLPSEQVTHEEKMRVEGFPDYNVFPVFERSIYTALIYLEPF